MKKVKKEKPKKKMNWKQWIPMAFFMLVGAGCGAFIAKYLKSMSERGTTFGEDILRLALLILVMYVCMFIQIVIHEAGHLVFGRLTGYEFVSFRIGSFMWIKEEGKLKLKRYSLAGTGGQCLMICDRIYLELAGENRADVIEQMWTKELKKFMKSMKTFPSILRTEYAYELLGRNKPKKAEKVKALFEKTALKYPYPSDMQSERELMEHAQKCWEKKQA